jgi:hypothetical protein
MQYGYGAPPKRTSGIAIAALVCGLLGCIPFVTSLAATILGLVGVAVTGKPNVGGRAMAIIGLLLGLLGLAGWGYGSYAMVKFMGPVFEIAAEMQALPQHQDFTKFNKWVDDPAVKAELQRLTDTAKAKGGIKSIDVNNQSRNTNSSGNNGEITGTISFGDGTKAPFSVRLDFSSGKFVISKVAVDTSTGPEKN